MLTNDRHHHELLFPVARRLASRHSLCLLSFCEFRGLRTPISEWRSIGAEVRRVPPVSMRPTSSAADRVVASGKRFGAGRARLQSWVWWAALRPFLRLDKIDLAVLCNDTAFPGSRVVDMLNQRGCPFVLVPEGIRFPLPGETTAAFGTRGASAIACWGMASADYFESLGIQRDRLVVTGCPRYDTILRRDWQVEVQQARASGLMPEQYLLFASNPVDDQGFCSKAQKLAAWASFVAEWVPLLEVNGLKLAVRLHPRERLPEFRSSLPEELFSKLVFLPPSLSLHTVIRGSSGVIVWASTVGLEALMHGKRLAVMAVPGHGYVFDYVSSGAAQPIQLQKTDNPERFITGIEEVSRGVSAYLERHIALRGHASQHVARLCERVLERRAVTREGHRQ